MTGMIQPAGAPHRFEHQRDQRDAEGDVPRIGEVLRSVKSSPPWIRYTTIATDSAQASQSHHMTRWRKRARDREHQEAQEQHEGDVHRAQRLRGHDGVGGVEVERRHPEGDGDHEDVQPAPQLVGRAFLVLDEYFGLVERFVADDDVPAEVGSARA